MVLLSTYCTLGASVAQAVKGGTYQLSGLDCVFPATHGHSKPTKQDSGISLCAHLSDTANAESVSPSDSLSNISERNFVGEGVHTKDQLDPLITSRTDVIGSTDHRDAKKRIPDGLPLNTDRSDISSIEKRDVEDLSQMIKDIPITNATILGEIPKFSDNPLKDAFSVLEKREWIEGCLAGSTEIVTNIFPREKTHGFVTGLKGKYKLPKDLTIGEEVGTKYEGETFYKNDELSWEVRWDYEPPEAGKPDPKFNHVNSEWSTGQGKRVKFAYRLNQGGAQWWGKGTEMEQHRRTGNSIWQKMNKLVGYVYIENANRPVRKWPQSNPRFCLEALKDYFRRVAVGEIVPQ